MRLKLATTAASAARAVRTASQSKTLSTKAASPHVQLAAASGSGTPTASKKASSTRDVFQASGLNASRAQAAPPSLTLFDKGTRSYSATELNDALRTVFGEISSRPHARLPMEARAVASTIFNRHADITKSRAAHSKAAGELDTAKQRYQSALKSFDELSRNPTRYKRELTEKGYAAAFSKARTEHATAKHAYAEAQNRLLSASDAKKANETYLPAGKRTEAKVTLGMVVEDPKQYEGTKKGHEDALNYPGMNEADKQRNAERWEAAKAAVLSVAEDPSQAYPFRQFRSNRGGARVLKPQETRIGGNDFW